MEMKFVVETNHVSSGQPLRICISGGCLEVLGFAHGKKVAIEEAYGRLSISLLEVEELAQVVPVTVEAPVQSVHVHSEQEKPVVASQQAPVEPSEQSGLSLFQELVTLRKQIASEVGLPPYIIFHDVTLQEMCQSMPSTLQALKSIQGVGTAKLQKYGERFLEAIRQYVASKVEGGSL